MSTASTTDAPPQNANENCVGPNSSNAGKASSCAGCPNQSACADGSAKAKLEKTVISVEQALQPIRNILLVLSGKGGVGKSTVACQLAQSLSLLNDYRVGVLDVDICGPSVARMLLGEEMHQGSQVHRSGSGWSPVYVHENLSVMSISFLLPDRDAAVVWRGPRKNGLIEQFLCETDWGCDQDSDVDALDYLIIDTPPGTSDEHISTVQYLMAGLKNNKASGISNQRQNIQAVVVTTSEEASLADVRKELNFCQKTDLPVLGIIENMSSFEAPFQSLNFMDDNGEDCTRQALELIRSKCPQLLGMNIRSALFTRPVDNMDHNSCSSSVGCSTAVEALAKRYKTQVLGSIPMDPNMLKACEEGLCFTDTFQATEESRGSPAVKAFESIVQQIDKACNFSTNQLNEVMDES